MRPKNILEFCKVGNFADISFYDGIQILSTGTTYSNLNSVTYYEISSASVISDGVTTKPTAVITPSKSDPSLTVDDRCQNFVSMIEVEYKKNESGEILGDLHIYYKAEETFTTETLQYTFYYSMVPVGEDYG